ncbi:TetR/AcrR family transcriptional regulator [Fodinicola acaciae]|uniref:TetR/AcrR family transcriptional regulator n=1 Tax=Fodinicola acaciae TaxID=2681555 RepID=UPI0013CFD3E2|nr:TetR/AcrR family transcriptional regulator [Fodinicola acaciae]
MAERADVVRNRSAVLDAATALFARDDLGHVTLARIAEAAGVGKATVLRHYGSLEGVIEAVLARQVAAVQERVRTGEPPLGPGGSADERVHAFLDTLIDFVLGNRALIRAIEHRRPDAYYANPASQFWIAELGRRIRAVDSETDAGYRAYVVVTAVRADVVDYLRTAEKMSVRRIRAGLHALVVSGH